jgi:CRISPR type IV-associated protein Csf2
MSFSETLYLGLTCGAGSGNPENDKSVEEVVRANQNIYMGVFGGGTRMLRGGYRVQDLEPITQTTIDAGMVPAHLGDPMEGGFIPMEYKDGVTSPIREGYKLQHTYNILRVDDIMRATRVDELTSMITGGLEAVAEYQASVMSERSEGKAAKASAKEANTEIEKVARNRVENMQNFRAVAPGVPFYFRMDMNDTLTLEQTGALILCLRDLIDEGEFGGYVRCGLGKVAVKEMKLVIDGHVFALFENDDDLTLSAKAAELTALAEKAIDNLTVEEMGLFFNRTKAQ